MRFKMRVTRDEEAAGKRWLFAGEYWSQTKRLLKLQNGLWIFLLISTGFSLEDVNLW